MLELRSWINYGIYGVCIIVGIELGVVLVARMNWQEVWSGIWLNLELWKSTRSRRERVSMRRDL